MKKAIAILLVLLVAGVVFGADQTLKITSSVNVNERFLLSTSTIDQTTFDAAESEETLAMGTETTSTLYLGLRTNNKLSTSVKLSGSALTTGDEDDTQNIGYTISTSSAGYWTKVSDLVVSDTATVLAKASVNLGTFDSGNGMRVMSVPATITLNSDDLALASASTAYTAYLLVEVWTN